MSISVSNAGAALYPESPGFVIRLESTKVSFSMSVTAGAQTRVQLTNAPGLFLVEIRTNETAAAAVSVQYKIGSSSVDATTDPNVQSWLVSAAAYGYNAKLFHVVEGTISSASPYLSVYNGGGQTINVSITKVD